MEVETKSEQLCSDVVCRLFFVGTFVVQSWSVWNLIIWLIDLFLKKSLKEKNEFHGKSPIKIYPFFMEGKAHCEKISFSPLHWLIYLEQLGVFWLIEPAFINCLFIFSGGNLDETKSEELLDLMYDAELNCYFDPVTHKYYELNWNCFSFGLCSHSTTSLTSCFLVSNLHTTCFSIIYEVYLIN